MTPASRAGGTALAAAFSLCACVASPISADAPKTVRGHWLPPYGVHEECLRLEPGDRAEFAFESTEPVDFNFHYHDGQAVVMPLVREKSRGDAGRVRAAPRAGLLPDVGSRPGGRAARLPSPPEARRP